MKIPKNTTTHLWTKTADGGWYCQRCGKVYVSQNPDDKPALFGCKRKKKHVNFATRRQHRNRLQAVDGWYQSI